ncbi:CHAT domain-containing protein, partial [Microcystis sp. M112S1]
ATTQDNLAFAYVNRIRGDKAENLDQAIAAYREALKVRTFEAFPQDWAATQNNLAAAYYSRIRGDKADNLEHAIAGYREALKVYTFEAFPQDWARTQDNLANAIKLQSINAHINQDLIQRSIIGQAYLTDKPIPVSSYSPPLAVDIPPTEVSDSPSLAVDIPSTEVSDSPSLARKNQPTSKNKNIRFIYFLEKLLYKIARSFVVLLAGVFTIVFSIIYLIIFPSYRRKMQSYGIYSKAEYPAAMLEFPPIHKPLQSISESRFIFLKETFLKVCINPNPKLIYPFWEKNLDKFALHEILDVVLQAWMIETLQKVTFYQAYCIALDLANFSQLIQHFPLGCASENLDTAIIGYKISLRILTFNAYPKDWAYQQYNLGNAYFNREVGNKEENLEEAIICFCAALKVYSRRSFSIEWARIQYQLGNAYIRRIRVSNNVDLRKVENNVENLEKAITCYKEALTVYTHEAFPQEWEITQNSLVSAYREKIQNTIVVDFFNNSIGERAIACCTEALKVYTFDAFPQDWAMTQNNLANAYRDRIRGDEAENLEQAIAYYRNALKVYAFEAFPENWADTQNNLANVYSDTIRWDNAENLEIAITYYREALKVYTFEGFPQKWAMTQKNLAVVYSNRIKDDKAKNLEMAIAYCQEALKVYTFDAFPQDWADIQNILAMAYSNRIEGNKANNLEQAITACQKALKVYTFEAFTQKWAMTQNNLALAYSNRIRDNRAKNLEKAIVCYHNALKIYTKENYPLNCLDTAWNLGILYYDEKQWKPAIETYNIAIEAVENARLEGLNPHSRQQVLSNNIDVFYRIVQAYLNLNQPEKALEYIERSKGRNLVELMTQKNLQPQDVSPEIIAQLNELKQRVVNEQIRLQSQSMKQMRSDENDHLIRYSYLKEYQQELDNFIEREIKPIDPIFSLTQKVEPIPFTDIKALTDAETCLLQWYITRDKILAFVVSADGDVKYWQSSKDNVQQLIDTLLNYLQLYYSQNGKQEWENQLSNLLQTFADNLHINDILALIPDTCKRLIIIPHYFLHILPIHAFPINESQILLDKYDVQYAPSCQILQKISQTFHHSDFNKLFAIQNPTKDLFYTDLEVNILSTFFTEPQVIAKDNATKNAVLPHLKSSDNHCYHFSCHGGFNPDNPLESALFLANKEPLTLGEIFELRLNKCRLVTLAACETGLIDLNSISDEYIGLPSGFLFAGSPSVVSSLWTVNDLSTSFLMIKFYEILFDENQQVSVPVALKQAQYWLQDLTIDKLDEFLQQYQPQIDKHLVQLRPGQRKIYQKSLERIRERQPYPFANPYYWAGFTATGI